ncbi:MAG: polyamine aminopropyltransferase [Deltaproteobacteria bacterium]|nr:polyamine aminopropyltransferase [Deltaproteobacteria bacterium]
MFRISLVLKIAIFATGCAGIVAEFVLSTLATYLIGNAVFQWTIVMSLMLFAMGLGSRLSKYFKYRLLDTFVLVEFSLSILCSSSTVLAYGLAAYTAHINLLIYLTAMVIGGLIGLEIPLVTRLNETHEELKYNIATMMEKDYYGSLLGGLFFAFFALPYLGLTYTPIILGAINFLVASLLLWSFFHLIQRKKVVVSAFAASCLFLIFLTVLAKPIIMYSEQRQYKDKIIYAQQSLYQKIVITQWKEYYWLFINGQQQFSSFDEEKYHEPLVHPAMKLSANQKNILILGGGDGLALREVLKYPDVKSVTIVDLDQAMTDLAAQHPALVDINKASMNDPRIEVVNQDAGMFLKEDDHYYGAVIIDLPDPDSIDLMHLYCVNFYRLVARHLRPGGVMVTQATSPYFSQQAFLCIIKTINKAGFTSLAYHNQIPTMGEWGWVLGVKSAEMDEQTLKQRILTTDFDSLKTRFLNNNAMVSMIHFGKGVIDPNHMDKIKINTRLNPVLQDYYRAGTWGMY